MNQNTRHYDNLLGVPDESQIKGFYGDEIIQDFFPFIESKKGRKYQCKCCQALLSPLTTQSKLRDHLVRHALLIQGDFINGFERAEVADKLRCKTCGREVFFKNVPLHSDTCKIKTESSTSRKADKPGQKKGKTLLEKRTFEDRHDMAYQNSDSSKTIPREGLDKREDGRNEVEKEQEEEEKIEKKVKTDCSRASLTERGPLSLKSQLVSLFKQNSKLSERALKLKLADILEPFQKQWEDDQKKWKREIEELKQAHIRDNEEKERKMQELVEKITNIEKQKEDLEKMVDESKKNIKEELSTEWETRFSQLEMRLSTQMSAQILRNVDN